jgi:hypothetical protein
MKTILSQIRAIVEQIRDTEKFVLMADLHEPWNRTAWDQFYCQQEQRLCDLFELFGPLRRAVERFGWTADTLTFRLNALYSAAAAVTCWVDPATVSNIINVQNTKTPGRPDPYIFEVNLDGGPAKRLEALIGNVESTLQRVLALDVSGGESLTPDTHQSDEADLPPARPAEHPPEERLVFDRETLTVTLDKRKYEGLDPTAFHILREIAEGEGKPVRSETLLGLPSVRGKNIQRELRKLPPELRAIIPGRPGSGRHLCLPQQNSR